jgi:hypothetical protein
MIITTIATPKSLPGSTTHAWYRGKAGPEKKCMEEFEAEFPWLKQEYTGFYCTANSTMYVPLEYVHATR